MRLLDNSPQFIIGVAVSSETYTYPFSDNVAYVSSKFKYVPSNNAIVNHCDDTLIPVSYDEDGFGYVELTRLRLSTHTLNDTVDTIIIPCN